MNSLWKWEFWFPILTQTSFLCDLLNWPDNYLTELLGGLEQAVSSL